MLTRLYGLIAEETGARVIVDSSKIATNAYLMAAITDLDLYVVHLVRDPRAVAHSWRRAKGPDPTGRTSLEEIGPMRSSREWLRRNAIAEICGHRLPPSRYMRVRYEDLTADPSGVIRAIRAFAGEPGGDRFVDTGTVRLGSNHMIGGNPRRFETGEIEIRPDSAWTTTMSTRNRALATLPALPLMRRYGYRSTL